LYPLQGNGTLTEDDAERSQNSLWLIRWALASLTLVQLMSSFTFVWLAWPAHLVSCIICHYCHRMCFSSPSLNKYNAWVTPTREKEFRTKEPLMGA